MLFFFSRPFYSFNAKFFFMTSMLQQTQKPFLQTFIYSWYLALHHTSVPMRMNEKVKKRKRRNKWNVLKIICWKFEQVEKFCKFFVLFCLHLKVYIIWKTMNCININTAKAIARARARDRARAGAIHHAVCNINFVYRCWIKYRAYRYGKLVQFKDRITDLMTAHSYVVHKFPIIIHENHKNEVFVVYWRINGIDRIEQHLLLYRTI